MADDLAAILAVVVFMGILLTYSFLETLITDLATTIGLQAGPLPSGLSGIIFLAAIGIAIVVYMRTER
jgi:hypothetical protein